MSLQTWLNIFFTIAIVVICLFVEHDINRNARRIKKCREVNLLLLTHMGALLPEAIYDNLLDDIVSVKSFTKNDIQCIRKIKSDRIKKGDFIGDNTQ